MNPKIFYDNTVRHTHCMRRAFDHMLGVLRSDLGCEMVQNKDECDLRIIRGPRGEWPVASDRSPGHTKVVLSFGYEDPLTLLTAAGEAEAPDTAAYVKDKLERHDITKLFTDSQTLARLGLDSIQFMLPPLSQLHFEEPQAQKTPEFRCIVPTIEDRDFSLVAYVASKFPDNTVLFVAADAEHNQTPEELLPFVRVYEIEDEHEIYSSALAYLPAPRVLDYRLGIIPIEILQAALSGTTPILVQHTVLEPLRQWLTLEPSLTSINNTLVRLLNGDTELLGDIERELEVFRRDHERLSPAYVAQAIMDVYWNEDGKTRD